MGHKANPNSLRLILHKNWQSKWFTQRNFALYLLEDIKIKEAINKKLPRTGIASINISRDAQQIKIIISTSKPGMIIGRSGQGIADLNKFLEKKIANIRHEFSYTFKKHFIIEKNLTNKIKIDIVEIRDPETVANLVAQNIAQQLEKRVAHRKAIKQAISKVMQKKALGVKINVAGRLGGVEIARSENFGEGSIPLGTFKANVDYGFDTAFTVYGTIGVKVWIYKRSE